MISYLGDFAEDNTVYIMFNTFSSDDPSASCTITNFVNTDVHIHKDDGLTQRNNAAGITVSVDFDGITGSHMVKIDTSDNTVAGFWVVGHEYFVRIEGTTIDGATINSVIGQFSIENRYNEVDVVKWLGTAAATPTVAGVPEVDLTHWLGTGVSVNVAGKPTVDVTNIGASSQSLIDLKDFVDSGYDPVTNKVQGVVLADTVTTLTGHTAQTGDSFALANGASGFVNIIADTNELQTDWVNGGRLDLILDIIAADTTTDIPALIAALNNISTAQVNTEVDTALSDIHLDHLLAADYDPAAKPGVATALLNELIESDGGVSRYTANAIEQAPIADVSALATSAALSTHDGKLDTADANIDTLLTRITAAVALASDLATAQADLDTITGTDGVTLATAQALYAPNKVVPDVAGTAAGLHSTTDGKIDTVDANVDSILADTGTDGVLLAATATSAQLIDDVWDELITGALHNTATSAGRRLLELGAYHISSGTAQAGSAHSITLDAGETAGDHIFNRNLIVLQAGTGAGQTRTIVDYDGTSKIAVIDRDWVTNPDATSEYSIIPDDTPLVANHGVATAGTSTTITISTTASAINDTYVNSIIQIMAGTGAGQSYLIDSYNGTTKVVTVCGTWITTPDNTSVYVILPYGVSNVCNIATEALALINTECDTALTDYDPPTRTEATADKDAIITEVNANETKIDALQTDSTAIKAKTDNLPSGISKNVALPKFDIYMVLNSDHVTAATGKTITGQISKDGGAFAGITNVISEVGNGMYTIASGFTQTEMNADVITLKFTETDCDQRIITIYTS